MSKKIKKQTFKDRLILLMGDERPYTWSKHVGIEKGLFQYYWQKGKVPTYENLLKIANYSGCSIHWLLTGEDVNVDKTVRGLSMKATEMLDSKKQRAFVHSVISLQSAFAKCKTDDEVKFLQGVCERLI